MTYFDMWPQVATCFILLQYLVAGDQIRGIPGVDYPTYTEIPRTSFRCSQHGLGFFADLETRCQVFHHCYEHRRESFLCPPGTIFNQGINACDYWYSAECQPEDEVSYQPVGKSADAVYKKIASLYEKSESDENTRTGEVRTEQEDLDPYEDSFRQHESSSENQVMDHHGMNQMVFAGQSESQRNKEDESQEGLESSTDDPNREVQFDVMDQNMGQFKFVSENQDSQEEQFQQQHTLVYDEDRQTYEDSYFENEDRHQLISDPNDYSDFVYLPMDAVPEDAFEYADEDHALFLRRDSSSHRPPRKSSRPRPVYVEVEPSVEQPTISMPTRKRVRLNQNQQELSSEDYSEVQTEPSEMTTVATLVENSDQQINLGSPNTETDESEYPIFYSNDNEFDSQEHGFASSDDETAVTDENFSSASFEYVSDGTTNAEQTFQEIVTEDFGVENKEETPFYINENHEVMVNSQESSHESLEMNGASRMDEGFQNENLQFDDTTDANTEWQVVTEHPFVIADETTPDEQLEYEDGSNEFSDEMKEWDFQEQAIRNENQLHSLFPTPEPIATSEDEVQETKQDLPAEVLNFEELISMPSTELLQIDHKQDQSVVEYADVNSEDVSREVTTEALNDSDDEPVHDTKPSKHFHEIASITNEQISNFTEANKNSDEKIQQIGHKISDQPFFQDHSWPELSENPPLPSDFDSIVPPVNTLEHENKESLDKFFNHQSVIISELSPNTVVDSSKAFPSKKVKQSVPQEGFNQAFSSHEVSQSVEGPPSNPQVFGRSLADPRFMNFGFNPNSNYLDTVNFPTLTRQLFSPLIQPFNTGDDNELKSRQLKDTPSTGWSSFKLFAKKLMTSKKAAMDTFRAHYNSFDN